MWYLKIKIEWEFVLCQLNVVSSQKSLVEKFNWNVSLFYAFAIDIICK